MEILEDRLALSLSTIAIFTGSDAITPNGGLAMDSGGNLYGTAPRGGVYGQGSVFEIAKGSGVMTTLASFDGTDGFSPNGSLLLDSNGNLYGTTSAIPASGTDTGDGTVFEVKKGSGTITTLASFDGTDGYNPNGALVMDGAGNLYGTTSGSWQQVGSTGSGEGVYDNAGTVFEIPKAGGTITTLAAFDTTDGETPNDGLLLDSAGNVYGTTSSGGKNGNGTVFEVASGSGQITTLADFASTGFGTAKCGLVMDSEGDLFGTTADTETSNGSVFELAKGSDTITLVASLGNSVSGALVMDRNDNLYGATASRRDGDQIFPGSIFEITKGSTTVTTLHSFSELGSDGSGVSGPLLLDTTGNLYGATTDGGTNYVGSVFELPQGSQSIVTLASAEGGNGRDPNGGIVVDANGNLYGTTPSGRRNEGAVFEVAKGSGAVTTLVSFDGTNFDYPDTGLAVDASGNLYGTAVSSPSSGSDIVFEVAKGSDTITTLATFTNGGPSALTIDSSGNLYGTTASGGSHGVGMVFEIPAGTGTIQTLASFDQGVNVNGVVIDGDGNLYGVTTTVEDTPAGLISTIAIFEVVQGSGTITTLATASQGLRLSDRVVVDAAGNLYGTMSESGTAGGVFELAKGSGTLTTLASFTGSDGAGPGDLTIDGGGNLYGTTSQGGANGDGTLFELAEGSNTITALASFGDAVSGDGADVSPIVDPVGVLAIDNKGNLYGVSDGGGDANGDGTVFEYSTAATTGMPVVTTGQANSISATGTTLNGSVNPNGSTATAYFQYSTEPTFPPTVQTAAAMPSSLSGSVATAVSATLTGLTPGTTYYYRLVSTDADGTSVDTQSPPKSFTTTNLLTGATTASAAGAIEGANPATLAGATFTDTNTAAAASDFSVTAINWGDGDTDTTGLSISGSNGNYTLSGSHLYAEEGAYNFSITVTDAGGDTASIAGSATVADAPLVVTGTSLAALVDSALTSGVATFTDPAGPEPRADYSATIDWGDGSSTSGTLGGPNANGLFTISGSHTYTTVGTPTITVTVHHDAVTPDATVHDAVTVSNSPVQVNGTGVGTLAATELTTLTAAVATFTDPNGAQPASDYTAAIDWGEGGSTSQGTISSPDANGVFTVTGSHAYATASAVETIDVVIDRTGLPDATVTSTAAVSPAAVNGNGASLSGTVGTAFSAMSVATFTFADGSRPASDFTATIDWGDGQTSAGTVSETGTTYSVAGTHTYTTAGTFATTTAVMEEGNSTAVTGTAVIGLTPAQSYVSAVFEDVLGRAVDPSGLQYWTQQIAGGMPISGVAQAIAQSAEYYSNDVIEPDYLKLLGRAADDTGVQYWVGQMQAGVTDQELEAYLVASDEFYNNATNGPGVHPLLLIPQLTWLNAAYEALLGRPIDSAGENYWAGRLQQGAALLQVALGIADSAENNTQLINDDYFHFLGRAADSAGLAYWLGQFANGATNEDVIAGFTGSAEYYDEHTT